MGTIMGKSGYLYVQMGDSIPSTPTAIECVDNWSMSFSEDAVEDTGFGTTTDVIYKSFSSGLKSATGSAAGNFDATDPRLSVIAAVFIGSETTTINAAFYLDSNHHVSVVCVMTGFSIGEPVADKVTFGFDFTVSGTPVYA